MREHHRLGPCGYHYSTWTVFLLDPTWQRSRNSPSRTDVEEVVRNCLSEVRTQHVGLDSSAADKQQLLHVHADQWKRQKDTSSSRLACYACFVFVFMGNKISVGAYLFCKSVFFSFFLHCSQTVYRNLCHHWHENTLAEFFSILGVELWSTEYLLGCDWNGRLARMNVKLTNLQKWVITHVSMVPNLTGSFPTVVLEMSPITELRPDPVFSMKFLIKCIFTELGHIVSCCSSREKHSQMFALLAKWSKNGIDCSCTSDWKLNQPPRGFSDPSCWTSHLIWLLLFCFTLRCCDIT